MGVLVKGVQDGAVGSLERVRADHLDDFTRLGEALAVGALCDGSAHACIEYYETGESQPIIGSKGLPLFLMVSPGLRRWDMSRINELEKGWGPNQEAQPAFSYMLRHGPEPAPTRGSPLLSSAFVPRPHYEI
jgi:hypothetical protein